MVIQAPPGSRGLVLTSPPFTPLLVRDRSEEGRCGGTAETPLATVFEVWAARVRRIAQEAEDTYVVPNNHHLGKSTVNALLLKAFLCGRPFETPPNPTR